VPIVTQRDQRLDGPPTETIAVILSMRTSARPSAHAPVVTVMDRATPRLMGRQWLAAWWLWRRLAWWRASRHRPPARQVAVGPKTADHGCMGDDDNRVEAGSKGLAGRSSKGRQPFVIRGLLALLGPGLVGIGVAAIFTAPTRLKGSK